VVDEPSPGVLAAFGLTGTPVRLPGGQGAGWRAGQLAAVRRATEPATKLLLARAAVLDSGP